MDILGSSNINLRFPLRGRGRGISRGEWEYRVKEEGGRGYIKSGRVKKEVLLCVCSSFIASRVVTIAFSTNVAFSGSL